MKRTANSKERAERYAEREHEPKDAARKAHEARKSLAARGNKKAIEMLARDEAFARAVADATAYWARQR